MLSEPGARLVTLACALLALVGLGFAATTAMAGPSAITLLFALMPVLALATWRTRRWARLPLLLVSGASLPPLATGVLGSSSPFAWPTLLFTLGVTATIVGMALLLTASARKWFAITAAHRVLTEPKR